MEYLFVSKRRKEETILSEISLKYELRKSPSILIGKTMLIKEKNPKLTRFNLLSPLRNRLMILLNKGKRRSIHTWIDNSKTMLFITFPPIYFIQ